MVLETAFQISVALAFIVSQFLYNKTPAATNKPIAAITSVIGLVKMPLQYLMP